MNKQALTSYRDVERAKPTAVDGSGGMVLIGFGEALSAPEVAWNLLDAGFRVAAFIRRGRRVPIRHLRNVRLIEVTAPEDHAYETVDQLCNAAEALGADAILPLDDAAIWVCEAASPLLRAPIAGSSGTHARLVLDKRLQLETAADAGFLVPPTLCALSAQDVSHIDSFPVVLKPALAAAEVGGKLCRGPMGFCSDRQELDSFARKLTEDMPMLVQPVLSGTGEGLFGLAVPGGVRGWSAHRRIRMMNPAGSGSSACRSLPITDQPMDCAKTMLKKVNWQGLFMIELLRDQSNQIWFMELNGRPWGSMALALRRGFEYPAWTVMQTLDPSFAPPPEFSSEPITCRHLGREIVHLLMVLRKRNSATPMRGRWNAVSEVCRLSRRDRWYNWRPGNTTLFLEDTIGTVLGRILSVLRRQRVS